MPQRDGKTTFRELSVFAEATSRLVARAACCALALTLSCALTGCSFFKQFGKDRAPENNTGGGVAPPKFPTGGNANQQGVAGNFAPANSVTNPANQGAILAGRVVDNFSRPPANTSIRWVNLDEKKDTETEVSVTPEGYFTILGLKEGGRYKLLARGKQGERLVAGVTYATASNARIFIQVKEDLANGSTPPVPGPVGAALLNDWNKTPGLGAKSNPGSWTAGPGSANEPDLPVAININRQPSTPSGPPAQNWSAAPGAAEQKGTNWLPPTLEIPRKQTTLPPLQIPNGTQPALSNPPSVPTSVSDALSQARIPSCVRVGDRIVNFALNDVNGQPWELRYKKSKLVLVDFWRTDCVPCLQSLPHLKELQAKYGSYGLEVIGIANETEGSPQEQAYRVMNVCKRNGINYRQLLSTARDCPVRREFKVNFVPTLFLLDEQGFIVWQIEHSMTPAEQAELERVIYRRLTARAF